MIEIDDNILVETEKLGSNNGIVCTPEGLVLVDTPHRPSDALRWRRLVESLGHVEYLLHTDHHIDHTMGNYWIPGRIVSHAMTRERLMSAPPTRQYLEDLLAVIDPGALRYMDEYKVRLPTITYEKAMTLHVGGVTFELTHWRGHTLNSTIIHIPGQQVAFVGDLVCSAGLPAFIEADTFDWIKTVRHIESMDLRHIVPGHGPVCDLATATTFRGWMEDLVGEVETRLDRGMSRESAAAEVSYEDNIHIPTGGSPGYPQHLIDLFMRRSIETIYDHILERRAAKVCGLRAELGMSALQPISIASLSDEALVKIVQAITAGEFSPGERLSEAELARQLGISRGPLREALGRLEGRLVVRTPRVGVSVIQISRRISSSSSRSARPWRGWPAASRRSTSRTANSLPSPTCSRSTAAIRTSSASAAITSVRPTRTCTCRS